MANPNIVNVTSIFGSTTYLTPSNTSPTVWTALTPAVNTVNKVNNIVASNVTGAPVAVTVSINSATGGGGTAFDIAFQISVPANASLIIIDKTTAIYVGETQSIVVTVGVGNAIELTSSFEAIT